MKVVGGLKMRKLGRDHILVPEGGGLVNFNRMIALNDSAAYLWENVQEKEFSVDELRQLLMAEYDVDEETAGSDAAKLAQAWLDAGIITE